MTEQGYGNADPFGELIPASDEYAHINTGMLRIMICLAILLTIDI